MSNLQIEVRLDLIIQLLEKLPVSICDEMEKREELVKKQHVKIYQENINRCLSNIHQLNEMAMDNNFAESTVIKE